MSMHKAERKIKIVCAYCGSDDVRRDAWAEWDVDKQEWVLGTVFDAGHCEVCEGEAPLEEEWADEDEDEGDPDDLGLDMEEDTK